MALKLPKHWPVQILEHTVLQLTSRRLWRASIYKFINMTCVWECSKMWCNASKELDPTCSISVVSVWSFVGFVGSAWHSSLGSNHFNFRCNTWMVSLVTLFKTKNDQIAGKKYCRVARCRSISEFILGSLLWPFGCWIALRGQRQRPDLSEFYPQWTEFFVNLWILMFFKKKNVFLIATAARLTKPFFWKTFWDTETPPSPVQSCAFSIGPGVAAGLPELSLILTFVFWMLLGLQF